MLNLREAARVEQHDASTFAISQLTTLQIARPDIVGDLGAPLTHGTSTTGWTTTLEVEDVRDVEQPDYGQEGQAQDKVHAALVLERGGPLSAGLLEGELVAPEGSNLVCPCHLCSALYLC